MADGVIIQGMTGCGNAQPGGCFITGHDPSNGKELWRVNTVAQPDRPGGDTWNGLPVESRFGASAWIAGSYDPDQNLVFYGVGQPYPWIAEMRGTDARKARHEEQRALLGFDAGYRPEDGGDEMVPPVPPGRHVGPRLRL